MSRNGFPIETLCKGPMEPLFQSLKTLIDPVGSIPAAVNARRWLTPMFIICVAVVSSGVAVALKMDAARVVIPKLAESGELMKLSERELSEAVQQAERVSLVGGVAKGVFLIPLMLLLVAVALKIAAWLMGKKTIFAQLMSVSGLAFLPVGVFHFILAISAAKHPGLTPKSLEHLVPSSLSAFANASKSLEGLYNGIDFINIWAALALGIGFAAASNMKPWKGALFGLFLYALLVGSLFIGIPALMKSGGPS
jgi:hypothetical protein